VYAIYPKERFIGLRAVFRFAGKKIKFLREDEKGPVFSFLEAFCGYKPCIC